jgi:hypothetical protein
MRVRRHVGTIRLRELERRVPLGHEQGKGRSERVMRDRRVRRPADRLRRDIREEL